MSIRNTMLTALKTDLENNITVANGFSSKLKEVKRGIYYAEDFSIMPAVSFWCYKDAVQQHMLNSRKKRSLLVQMFLYANNKGDGAIDNIHNLVEDIESFLYDSTYWTYSDNTLIGDELKVYEGGVQDPIGIAILELQIKYLQD